MVRRIISAFFYILGGFFVYTVCLIAFTSIPKVGAFKFAIMGGFSIPALIFMVIGAAVCRFQNWKSSMGIALLSGVGLNLLVVFSFICILLTPELDKYFPQNSIASFNDYLSGFSVMAILAGLGFILLKANNKDNAIPAVQH
jgi:hypothetical protein